MKVGDVVVVYGNGVAHSDKRLAKITKITKTGQFETDGTSDTKFNSDGTQRGSNKWDGLRAYIPKPKEINEIREATEKKKHIKTIETLISKGSLKSLSLKQLAEIAEMLDY